MALPDWEYQILRAHVAREPDFGERAVYYLWQIALRSGMGGGELPIEKFDLWDDPWNTEVASVDEQRAMLRRSFDTKPPEEPE